MIRDRTVIKFVREGIVLKRTQKLIYVFLSLVSSVLLFISCFTMLCFRIMFQFLFRFRGSFSSSHTDSFDIKLASAKSFISKSSGGDKNDWLIDLAISEMKLQKSKPKAIFLDCIFSRKFWKPSIETCCLCLDIVQKAVCGGN